MNESLYVKNLPEKLHPSKLSLLLYTLFSQYGEVVSVKCKRSNKLRGQAWISFTNSEEATKAFQKLEGFLFCRKKMSVAYANSLSDEILRRVNEKGFRERLAIRRENNSKQNKN